MPPDSRWKAPRSRGIRQKNNEKTAAARESAAAVLSYKSLNLEQRSAGYNIALGQHLHIVRAIGHDDGGCGGMAGCADGIQIDLQQRSAAVTFWPSLTSAVKP